MRRAISLAKQRMINTRFWSDNFIVDKCNALDRLLFLYLLTNDKANIVGIYELPVRTAAFETGIDRDDLEKMLARLSPKIEYFDGWVYIRKFTNHQQKNPKVDAGIINELKNLPHSVLEKVKTLGIDSDRLSKAIDSLSIEYDKYKSEFKSKSKSKNHHTPQKAAKASDEASDEVQGENKAKEVQHPELEAAIDNFAEMRKKMRKPLTESARSLLRRNLRKMYPDREDLQIAAVEQSTLNGWQGVFELKEEPPPQDNARKRQLERINQEYHERRRLAPQRGT